MEPNFIKKVIYFLIDVPHIPRYRYGILNHCDHPIYNGKLEGVNNKIKVIKRKAYGFHDLRYFTLKIYQAFSH